jgi:hypothetical protein
LNFPDFRARNPADCATSNTSRSCFLNFIECKKKIRLQRAAQKSLSPFSSRSLY